MSTLEAEVEGLGKTVTLGEQHQRDLMHAELRAFTATMEKLEEKIDGLRSRKGESHEAFDRRIARLEDHTEQHCGELEEVRTSITKLGADVESLVDRSKSWKSYLIPSAVALTSLAVGWAGSVLVRVAGGG